MSYQHLTLTERFTLYESRMVLKESLSTIAAKMGRAKSTLSRELRRNQISNVKHLVGMEKREETVYLPDTAEVMAAKRREAAKSPFGSVSATCLQEIKARLALYHSPEQIAGRLKREGKEAVSYETIYQMIYADHEGLGEYKKYLRHSRERRARRGAGCSGRGQIPNRVGIEARPVEADEKQRVGHFEGDTIVGKGHRGAVVSYVDKASKFLLAALCPDRTARSVNEATVSLFEALPSTPLSFTFDNGKEFSKHEELSEKLNAACFFANPYASWERGLNEHTNGLLRQFFPKTTDFTKVQPQELKHAVDLINQRPRKSLDYRTPLEVIFPGHQDRCTSALNGPCNSSRSVEIRVFGERYGNLAQSIAIPDSLTQRRQVSLDLPYLPIGGCTQSHKQGCCQHEN
jgi:transposase, IS30 family